MRSHFGNPNAIRTIAEAIPLYGAGEFESPTRSTIPLLSLLVHSPETFAQILDSLGMPAESDLYLEYTVPPRRGQGNPSHTDVMVRSGDDALAIEAKWTESPSATVKAWLGQGTNPANRTLVLRGWLDYLEERLGRSLDPGQFEGVPYQMLHRAASAAATGSRPRLAYLLFTPLTVSKSTATPDQVRQALDDLWSRLGHPEAFPFHIVEVRLKATPVYESLRDLKKKEPATSKAVIAALRGSSPLFEFTPHSIRPITGGIHP